MKTRYFIIPPNAVRDGLIVLDGPEFHHSVRVSRVREGDIVRLIDGEGGLYEARVERIESERAIMRVLSFERVASLPPVDIALGAIKAPRLEIAVEKCTELGARAILIFLSKRCLPRGGEEGSSPRIERLSRKIVASCKQAGRARVPAVEMIESIEDLAKRIPSYGGVYVADPSGPREGRASGGAGGTLGIVGPEGGFSPEERELLVKAGATPLGLGPTRLRSETAAICLLYRLLNDSAPEDEGI